MPDRSEPLHSFLPTRFLLATCLLLATSFIMAIGCQTSPPDSLSQPNEKQQETRHVVALGRLIPYAKILSISAIPGQRLMSLQPEIQEGAVLKVPVAGPSPTKPGDPSKDKAPRNDKGTGGGTTSTEAQDPYLLGYLDSHAIRQTQLNALFAKRSLAEKKHQGEVRLAEVQLLQAKATYRQAQARQAEVEARKIRLDNLLEAAELTQQQYETLHHLRQDDPELVTPYQLARQKNQSQRAMLEYETASSSLKPALEAATASIDAARQGVDVAQANRQELQEIEQYQLAAIDMEIEAARKMVAQSELRLPKQEWLPGRHSSRPRTIQYTVLKIFMQPGEFITQLPILQVADLSHMACVAEVYEADTKRVRVGQKAILRSSAFSGNYAPQADSGKGGIPGTVRRISNIISSPGLTDRNPLAPMDRSVVEVLIEIDPKDVQATQEGGKFVDLQVTVEFISEPSFP